ncbi:cytochrome P450 89A2-like [Lolium rigidum]|uniref:cytochrome P450 89A2-like n=1 Tax=Lolium rigidum TaxID=89674 RepID=UPI001F5D91D5|nr:cytochrome P450 89A2-like [Lolium rigidum]
METIEALALVAAVLFCLAVLRRSTSPAVQLVRDPAVAHRLLNENADALSNRPSAGLLTALATWTRRPDRTETISTSTYGSHWRSLRSNLTAGFLSPSRLAALAPLQRDAAQDLVTGLSAGEVVMREHLDRAMFAMATRLCFGDGVEESCVRAMQRVMDDITQAMDDTVSFDGSTLGKITHWRTLRRLFGLFVPLGVLVRPLIAAARARKNTESESRHSYVDSLIDIRIPNDVDAKRALGDDEILGLVAEFLATNTGVIVACLEWTLANLAIQPEVQQKLRREIDEAVEGEANAWLSEKALRDMPYLRAVVLESLRVHPPSPHGSAWTDPDQFRPERFLPGGEAEDVGQMPGRSEIRMMPFGGGRRFCPGSNMAMLQAKFFLAALVRHFEFAPPSCGVDLTEVGGFNNVMKKPLRVRVTPRALP